MSKYTDDFEEAIDLTVAPWKTLAPLCWNEPSPFRLGAKAEEHGVSDNPFKKPRTRGLFEEGRQSWRNYCGITPETSGARSASDLGDLLASTGTNAGTT